MLNESPFAELSMPTLAAEAGVSVGGLYGHFPSRAALFDEIQLRYRERRTARLDAALDPGEAPAGLHDRVTALARAFVELHSDEAGVIRSFLITNWLDTAAGPPHEVLEEIRRHKRACETYLLGACESPAGARTARRVSRAVDYLISVSKDQLVITPDTDAEAKAIDREQLVRDIADMITPLITGGVDEDDDGRGPGRSTS
jgi:AcrR family transcriptional regulator